MQVTAEMIITRSGSSLPLDQRRRDALANYAEIAARAVGAKPQTWVRETWDLKDYEAKDLLKGNASEPVWERILKHKNGGWAVAIPILGAVIGQDLHDFIDKERRRHEDQASRLSSLVRDLRPLGSVRRDGSDELDTARTRRRAASDR